MSYSFKGTRKTLWSKHQDPHQVLIEAKGQAYQDYREQWRRTQNFELVTDLPTQIDFELNPSCNMKCPMCSWSAVETFGGGKSTWMSFDAYKKIIDEVGDGVKSINLNHVNEPLIRKDLPDFVRYATDAGIMEVMFNTNGMLLSADMSRRLIEAGLTKLSVSVDATTQETYDKIRIGGNFAKIMGNIEDFLRIRQEMNARAPLFKVTFLRLSVNEHELQPFLDTWGDYADLISIQNPVNPFSDEKGRERAESLGLKRPTEKARETGAVVEMEYEHTSKRCPQPFQRMVIRHDGDALPCCNFRGVDLVMGNVFTHGVRAVWQNEAMRKMREIQIEGRYYENPVCKACLDNASDDAPDPDKLKGS